MALLISKSQYAPQTHSYHQPPFPSSTSMAPAAQRSSDDNLMLGEIRSWDEKRVSEWLRSINCGKYSHIFESNNITGEMLLECDQSVLKEMGVTKVGDRVLIFVAVKALRTKAYGPNTSNRNTIASLDQLANTSYRSTGELPSTSYKGTPTQSTHRVTPPSSRSTSRKPEQNRPTLSSAAYTGPDSPAGPEYSKNYRDSRNMVSPPLNSGYYNNMPGSATSAARTPKTPHGSVGRMGHNPSPSLDGVMSLENVWQTCVKMIGAEGSTRVVNLVGSNTAEGVLKRALKKFSLPESDWSYYCIYTVEDNSVILLSDTELVRICCHDTSRPERGRLILRRKGSPPTSTEFRVAQEIAREQAVNTNMSTKSSKLGKLIGESTSDLVSSGSSPSPKKETASQSNGKPPKKLTAFFGQRPPSELISSNLAEYFPGHERGVLEETVRNSIRYSRRISKYANRLSVATTRSYASSLSDAPPVPSVAEAWLNTSGPGVPPLPSNRFRPKSLLPSVAYSTDDFGRDSLDTLPEEGTLTSNRKSYMSFQSGISDRVSVVVTDTEPGTDSYLHDQSNLTTPMTEVDFIGRAFMSQYGDDDDDDEDDLDFLQPMEDLKWIKGQLIGAGSFGSVYLALNALTGELMAVKQVETSGGSAAAEARKKSMLDALEREINLLKDLQHPNIVQYLASSKEDDHLNIFLEYVPGGSVAAMLNSYGPLPEPLIRNFVRQILTGLAYLHDKDIIHRDIKGANILVDNKGGIKISDFGISKKVETGLLTSGNHRPSLQGSVFWMAPEVVKQTSYTRKADIWSLGCLVVEMFTGTHPYPDCSQLQAIFQIGSKFAAPQIPPKSTAEAKAFLGKTFELDHNLRPSADELLQSPFLQPIVGAGAQD